VRSSNRDERRQSLGNVLKDSSWQGTKASGKGGHTSQVQETSVRRIPIGKNSAAEGLEAEGDAGSRERGTAGNHSPEKKSPDGQPGEIKGRRNSLRGEKLR